MPSIAVDPLDASHLVVAYMDYSLVETGYAGIGVSVSRDGGDTWEETALPVPEDFNQGAANPIVRFGNPPDDTHEPTPVFVSFMAATFLGEQPPLTNGDWGDRYMGMQSNNGVFVARSDDGGETWDDDDTVAVVSHLYPASIAPSLEPNDSILQANPTGLVADGSVTLSGLIGDGEFGDTSGDFDFYSFEAAPYQRIIVELDPLGSGLDSMIGVYDSSGELLEMVDSGGPSDSESLGFVTEIADTYFVSIVARQSGFPDLPDSEPEQLLPDDPFTPGGGAGAGTMGPYALTMTSDVPFEVIPDLAIDTFPLLPDGQDNPYYGNLYVVWTRLYPTGEFPREPEPWGGGHIMIARSEDGGATWETLEQENVTVLPHQDEDSPIGKNSGKGASPGWALVDQSHITIGPAGDIHVSTYFGGDFLVHYSTDGGESFVGSGETAERGFPFGSAESSRPFKALTDGLPGNSFRTHAKREIGADPARPGHVYVVEPIRIDDRLGDRLDGADVFFSRTTDYGNTWRTDFQIGPNPTPGSPIDPFEANDSAETAVNLGGVLQRVLPKLAVGPGDEDWFRVETLAVDTLVASVVFTGERPVPPDALQLELWDPKGTTRLAAGSDVLDEAGNVIGREVRHLAQTGETFLVRVYRSDAGQSGEETVFYSLRVQSQHGPLNDDNGGQTAMSSAADEVITGQAFSRLAVDDQGNICVIWYDTRRDPADHLLEVFGTVSTDGGRTFSPNFRISDVSFDADAGSFTDATGEENFYLGDFIGLAMAEGTAYAAWTDTRGGDQDIFFAHYAIDPAPAPLNDRFEPNETANEPTDLGRVVQRHLPKLATVPGDEDWFRVEAIATGELIVGAVPDGQTPLLLELWDETGTTRLATGSDVLDPTGAVIEQEIRFPSDAGQAFLVRILGADSSQGDADGSYSLRVQSLTADLGTRAFASVDGTVTAGGAALYLVEAAAAGSLEVELTGGDNVQGDLDLQLLDPESFAVYQPPVEPPTVAPSLEPNDSVLQANPTGLVGEGSVLVSGLIGDGEFGETSGDFDFYSLEADANQRINIEVNPLGSGLDSMIALYDSDGERLELVDSGGPKDSESLRFVTETADTYFVAVLAWQSGSPDLPDDPFVPGGGAGAGTTGRYGLTISAEAPAIIAPSVEPNDSILQANPTGLVGEGSVIVNGLIGDGEFGDDSGDFDFYSFEADASQKITVEVDPLGGGLDSMIALYDSGGALLELVDSGGPNDSESLTFVTETAGAYFVAIMAWQSGYPDLPDDPFAPGRGAGAGTTGPYALTITSEAAEPVGPGAVERASRPIQQGDVVLLLVTGADGSSGDFNLKVTNLDQWITPENETLFFPAGAGPSEAAFGDLNNDGSPDLVVSNGLTDTISVLLGNGDGTFQAPRQFAVGAFVSPCRVGDARQPNYRRDVVIGDFDGDEIADVAVTNYDSSDVSVLLGRGDGTFEPQRRFDAGSIPYAMDVRDVDGDGALDLVTIDMPPSARDPNTIAVLLGRGDGTFLPQRTFVPPNFLSLAGIRIAELNGDGWLDLVVSGAVDQGIDVYLGNGDGTFRFLGIFDALREAPNTEVADLDGDGNLDVVVASTNETNQVSVLLGHGDGTFQEPQNLLAGQQPFDVKIADFGSQVDLPDGSTLLGPPDGKPDLVVAISGIPRAGPAIGPAEVVMLAGIFQVDPSGEFVLFGPPLQVAGAKGPTGVHVSDINSDGAVDIAAVDRDGILVVFGEPPTIVPNDTPDTARDLGTVVHLVDQTQTIVPGHEDAWFTLTVPTEAAHGAGDEIIDFSALFEATEGAGLQMELFDSAGNLPGSMLGSGERFRVRAARGEKLWLHIFGVEGPDGTRGAGAYTLAIDVLPQVVSVEAQPLLPGVDARPGGPTTSMVITLQGDRLDATTAETPGNYTVIYFGPDGALGTADDRLIPIGGAGIGQPIVYNAGANVEVTSGLTYPTAVRQTVTLLFADPLPAGSYVIELSPAVQAAPFNEAELELLADAAEFTGHPVASFDGDQITEGARIEAVDLVLQAGALGDLAVFEAGTPFLGQLQDDLGALLDALLTEIGDDPTVTGSILDQILARLDPSLGEFGQRPTSILVIFLDPAPLDLLDPGGNRTVIDPQTNTVVNSIPRAYVGVSRNVELVVVAGAMGTYQLDVAGEFGMAEISPRARLGAVILGPARNEIINRTEDLRSGIRNFTFTVSPRMESPLSFWDLATGRATPTPAFVGVPHWASLFLGSVSSTGVIDDSIANPQPPGPSSISDEGSGGGESLVVRARRVFKELDLNGDGRLSLEEFKGWEQTPSEGVGGVFKLGDKDDSGNLSFEEFQPIFEAFEVSLEEFSSKPAEVVFKTPDEDKNGDKRDGEQIEGASDKADEGTVVGTGSELTGKNRDALQTVTIAAADEVVHARAVTYGTLLAPVTTDNVRFAALDARDAELTNVGGEGRQPTPKPMLGELIELIRFLWNLLASGVGG